MKKAILLTNMPESLESIRQSVSLLTGITIEKQHATTSDEALALLNKCFNGIVGDLLLVELQMPVAADAVELVAAFRDLEFPHKKNISIMILLEALAPTDVRSLSEDNIRYCLDREITVEDLEYVMNQNK